MGKQVEEVFMEWSHIFVEKQSEKKVVKPKKPAGPQKEDFFQDWVFNLTEIVSPKAAEPVEVLQRQRKSSSEGKSPEPVEVLQRQRKSSSEGKSPKRERKEGKQQKIFDELDVELTEIKDNRRNDFARNASIKTKKRNEAARKSIGKRIK